jgi:hypothetical protein
MFAKLVVGYGIVCPGRFFLGSQAVDMVADPAGVAKNADVLMEAVFVIVGWFLAALNILVRNLLFFFINRCAPFFRTTHRGKTFQRFAKSSIIQMAASLEPNIK